MALPRVLSNQGTTKLLGAAQTEGDRFKVITGQHIWVAKSIPASGSVYLELEIDDEDGKQWLPIYELKEADLITKGTLKSGSEQLEIAGGIYRVTASAAGPEVYISRLGTPFP